MRTSIGPRAARLHVGAGRSAISTGAGPFGFYAPLSSAPRPATRPAAARTENQVAKAVEADAIRSSLAAIQSVHHQEFHPASPAIAEVTPSPDLSELVAQRERAHLKGIGLFDRTGRREAKERALREACLEHQVMRAEAQHAAEAEQRSLDERWRKLRANDPDTVFGALATAFVDNTAMAAPVGVHKNTAFVVVWMPGPDVVPDRQVGTTPAGNLSIRAMTKAQHQDYYAQLICGQVLVTVKEAFAAAPSLASVTVLGARTGPADAYGEADIEPLVVAVIDRKRLDGVHWMDTTSDVILRGVSRELVLSRQGTARAVQPLDRRAHPELDELLDIIDVED